MDLSSSIKDDCSIGEGDEEASEPVRPSNAATCCSTMQVKETSALSHWAVYDKHHLLDKMFASLPEAIAGTHFKTHCCSHSAGLIVIMHGDDWLLSSRSTCNMKMIVSR